MRRQNGFTYLGLLLAIALIGIGLAAASEVWSTVARRQRLVQLNWVGQQYVQAIGSYYEASPGSQKAYPHSMDDLLEDQRFGFVRRHLRQVYSDPLTGIADWQLISAPGGGFMGVQPVNSDTETAVAREPLIYPGGPRWPRRPPAEMMPS